MKKALLKIFYPNKFITLLLCIFSAGLLIFVFCAHLEENPISYIAYLLSSYSLILFIIWFYKACKFSSNYIKETKLYKFYRNHSHVIIKISLILSAIINLIYGIFKLVMGIYYTSWWFITFAIYYLILWFMKISLIKDTNHFGENINKEYKKLKNAGIVLLLLNVVLIGMIVLIITKDHYVLYSGYLIYAMALYDFYLIITAIINVVKHKNNASPAISASKCISLTVAMISILSLELAMIYQFGNDDVNFKLIMTSCTVLGITLINSIMAIIMIYKGSKRNNLFDKNNN